MKLPLIVIAKPQLMKSPAILLRPGKWCFVHNLQDTTFDVEFDPPQNVSIETGEIIVHNPVTCVVTITNAGSEKSISIYIQRFFN